MLLINQQNLIYLFSRISFSRKLTDCFFITAFLTILCLPISGFCQQKLSDEELYGITAGESDGKEVYIDEETKTSSGTKIIVKGDLYAGPVTQSSQNTLTLTDYAQQNLNSLVNINAVNSPVNVLLNLNISVDSAIDSIQQGNTQSLLPIMK